MRSAATEWLTRSRLDDAPSVSAVDSVAMREPAASDVTRLLQSVRSGRDGAREELYEQVYRKLKSIAGARLAQERHGHTLQATALVNEAYLRLAPGEEHWENRAHFFGSAARAMRRILVDHARRHRASKRGGEAHRVTFADLAIAAEEPDVDVLSLDEALEALAKDEPRLAEVVQLRYFTGLGIAETAAVLGTSPATVKRDWTFARAWLLERMS
jgi:RNA polymerase sigma factor (TIGR02999 family)